MIEHRLGATVCRSALATAPDGRAAPPHGASTPPGLARDDPRWIRPLPWVDSMFRFVGVEGLLAAVALAVVNVVLPLGTLWLLARRRRRTIRTLMILPIAVAVPLYAFQEIGPALSLQLGPITVTALGVFLVGTVAGPPILAVAILAVRCLVRPSRGWKPLLTLTALTLASSALIAAAWIRDDLRSMPAIEHYGVSGWHLVLLPGLYATGLLVVVGWMLRRPYRWLRRRSPRSNAAARR